MNPDTLALLVYRLAVLLCGLGCIGMGYRLFRLGIFEKAGELKANWGGRSLLLKAAAPGTFFALFGSAIIAVTVWKGFTLESTSTAAPATKSFHPIERDPASPSEFQSALQAAVNGRPLTDKQKQALAIGLGLDVETHRGEAR